jgi:cytochrome P450
MLTREFMVKQVAALRPRIKAIVDELLDDLQARTPPADLVEAFALPLPSLVICELLGVPYGDHHYFQERTRTILRRATPPEDAMRAADELYDYLDRFVTGQEEVPADTLIGRLVVDRRRTGDLDHDQLVGIALLLLVAGHETTANMTSLSVLSVLQHPEWLAALRADPALVPAAVEELLRFHTIVQYGVPRVATADVEIDGALIRAGEGVILSLAAANRDGEAFAHPDELDIHRQAPSHVAFGFGVHQCLGQPLARVELQVALAAIVDRLPGLRLAIPSDEVPFRDDMLIYGVHALPVMW